MTNKLCVLCNCRVSDHASFWSGNGRTHPKTFALLERTPCFKKESVFYSYSCVWGQNLLKQTLHHTFLLRDPARHRRESRLVVPFFKMNQTNRIMLFKMKGPRADQRPLPASSKMKAMSKQPGPVSESSSGEDLNGENYKGTSKTVFSLGWHSLMDFKKGTFWNRNLDEPDTKPKRTYDNSVRAAAASYSRQQSAGAYSKNGKDPARIEGLVALASCHCSLFVSSKVMVPWAGFPTFICVPICSNPSPKSPPRLRCSEDLLQSSLPLQRSSQGFSIRLGHGKARSRLCGYSVQVI